MSLSLVRRIAEAVYQDEDESADGHAHVNEFTLLDVVGRGATGTVRRGVATTESGEEREYCLKSLSRRTLRRTREPCGVLRGGEDAERDEVVVYMNGLERLQREIEIMELLQASPGGDGPGGASRLLRLLQVIDDPEDDGIVLVTEFMPLGSVLRLRDAGSSGFVPSAGAGVSRYSDLCLKSLARDLLRGLEYMHSKCVCHRDIKPENLLLERDSRGELALKIADFGCAESFDREANPRALVSHTAGTPAFWPPESIRLRVDQDLGLDLDGDGGDIDPTSTVFSCYSADCWAAGAVLFCLAYLRLPFYSEEPNELFRLIVEEPLPLPDDAAALVLMQGLCCKEPAERWDVGGALASEYFVD